MPEWRIRKLRKNRPTLHFGDSVANGDFEVASRSEPPGEFDGPFTVAVVSDLNGSYGAKWYSGYVHDAVGWITGRLKPDLVVSTGDHVAGQKPGLDYAGMWDAFHEAVTEPLAEAGIPFAPTPGNHDASAAGGYRTERKRYEREWKKRRPNVEFVDQSHYPFRYAYEAGPALFVSINATVPGELSDEQFDWLKSVLENHDAKVKVVYGHLPLAPFAGRKKSETIGSKRLERMLKAQEVDLMLSGHHHAYYPGRRGDLQLVGLSCLGGGPRKLIGTDRRSRHGAVVLRIHDSGHIDVEARWGDEMRRHVDRTSLPPSIGQGQWQIRRLDL